MKHSEALSDSAHRAESPHWFEPMYELRAFVTEPGLPPLAEHSGAHRWMAYVTFRIQDRRLVINNVEIKAIGGDDAIIDVDAWRSFPVRRIEDTANLAHMQRLLIRFMMTKPPGQDDRLPAEEREAAKGRPLPMIKAPPSKARRLPNSFYQDVADAYTFCVEHGHHPLQRISQDASVPTTTASNWVREARRRGFLEPARTKGRAG